ncbi:unnamed protein product, partial [Polarella glacialis]
MGAEGVAAPLHLDIQREVEAVQSAYAKERRNLDALEKEVLRDLEQARRERHLGLQQAERQQLWWRPLALEIEGVGRTLDPRMAISQEFLLDLFPGTRFRLTFCPFGGSAVDRPLADHPAGDTPTKAAAEPAARKPLLAWADEREAQQKQLLKQKPGWRLELTASGGAAHFRIAASLTVLRGMPQPEQEAGGVSAAVLLAEVRHDVLEDGSQLFCEGTWPEGIWPYTMFEAESCKGGAWEE